MQTQDIPLWNLILILLIVTVAIFFLKRDVFFFFFFTSQQIVRMKCSLNYYKIGGLVADTDAKGKVYKKVSRNFLSIRWTPMAKCLQKSLYRQNFLDTYVEKLKRMKKDR